VAEINLKEAPQWKPGMFQILFLSMGQGDCCVITCPDGRHIMVDCGSNRPEEEINPMIDVSEILRSPDVLKLPNSIQDKLDSLILTHPDIDHINKIKETLGGNTYYALDTTSGKTNSYTFRRIPVDRVFFSEFDRFRWDLKDSPLRRYVEGCNETIYSGLGVSDLYCVALNGAFKVIDHWSPPFRESQYQMKDLVALDTVDTSWPGLFLSNDRVTIARANDNSWSVSIIAGGVQREQSDVSDSDGRNAASLVTLIKIGNEKILICGDATSSTENYLKTKFPDELKRVNLLHAPHHGSSLTSSTDAFIDLVQPRMVAVSVHMTQVGFHLPGKESIRRYLKYADKVSEERQTTYWDRMGNSDFDTAVKDWKTKQLSNPNDYLVQMDSQNREARIVLKKPPKSYTGITILDGLVATRPKYALYEEPITQEIKQTGKDHHLWYYFDGKG